MLIKFMADDSRLHIEGDGIIPSGCVKTPNFSVKLSDEWQNYSVTAQFKCRFGALHVASIEDEAEYPIPWECLSDAGAVAVTLMGISGDKVKTTLPATLSVRESLVTQGSQPQPPTAGAYEQYVNHVNQAVDGLHSDFNQHTNQVNQALDNMHNDFDQYKNQVNQVLDNAYNDFEQTSNKLNFMADISGLDDYPTAVAVMDYIENMMMPSLSDGMADDSIKCIPMPSAVVDYVLKKTYKPTWHKTTITVTDDTTTMVMLKDQKCYGVKAFIKTARSSVTGGMTLNLFKNGENDAFFRVNSDSYISATNEFTYGVMISELKDGMWDGEWYKPSASDSNIWTFAYKPRLSYHSATQADYPAADMVSVRAFGDLTIPKGSEIEIWRLY